MDQKRRLLREKIRSVTSHTFDALALELFVFQYEYTQVYRQWVDYMHVDPFSITEVRDIPFLPISLFKTARVFTGEESFQEKFLSSGTTGSTPSIHYIRDLEWYFEMSESCFEEQYGRVRDYCFLALLPSYLDRQGSSLVRMVGHFMEVSTFEESGFFLDDHDELLKRLLYCRDRDIPVVLIGVSFALLDFLSKYDIRYPSLIVMETGGMKGRREEISRDALHDMIKKGFGVDRVHSEYGMTELLSQSYSQGEGIFVESRHMKILIKEMTDPMAVLKDGRSGVINMIDLGNIDSCCFIETQDIGIKRKEGFEVLGRLDFADIRGCNLMVSDME